jgi:glycine/serine hydroxymethyltransferase
MDAADAWVIGTWIADVLESPADEAVAQRVRAQVHAWCEAHPVPSVHIDWRARREGAAR